MNKEQIFRKLYEEQLRREEWLDKIPSNINSVFFDNEYVNSMSIANDMLIEKVFDEHAESIFWFLHEWTPGAEVGYDGEYTKINGINQYILWMRNVEGFGYD